MEGVEPNFNKGKIYHRAVVPRTVGRRRGRLALELANLDHSFLPRYQDTCSIC